MHKYCYKADGTFNVWPDHRSYIDQADITVKMFMIINDEVAQVKGA